MSRQSAMLLTTPQWPSQRYRRRHCGCGNRVEQRQYEPGGRKAARFFLSGYAPADAVAACGQRLFFARDCTPCKVADWAHVSDVSLKRLGAEENAKRF